MPTIQYFSDIHLEFGPMDLPPTDADILVAAGDIGVGLEGLEWLRTAGKPVIYIAGNHEFYCGDMPELRARLRSAAAGTPVHFLDNSVVVVAGVRFLGATLWTDFHSGNEQLMGLARSHINDYVQIRNGELPLAPGDTVRANLEARRWLDEQLAQPFSGPTVVVTHHAPSHMSWKGTGQSLYRYAYCNELEHLMARYQPSLWIHGHIHHVNDYTLHQVRVLCNPRGYSGFQKVAGFDAGRTVTF